MGNKEVDGGGGGGGGEDTHNTQYIFYKLPDCKNVSINL